MALPWKATRPTNTFSTSRPFNTAVVLARCRRSMANTMVSYADDDWWLISSPTGTTFICPGRRRSPRNTAELFPVVTGDSTVRPFGGAP